VENLIKKLCSPIYFFEAVTQQVTLSRQFAFVVIQFVIVVPAQPSPVAQQTLRSSGCTIRLRFANAMKIFYPFFLTTCYAPVVVVFVL
jgi:hypothetical protein